MSSFCIKQSNLHGSIESSPSKSHTLRAILFAALAEGKSVVYHYLKSPDTIAMIEACRQLGAEITVASDCISIEGVAGNPRVPDEVIDAGNSGQVLRFVAAIAALNANYTILTGDNSVRHNRPMQPLIEGLGGLKTFCVSSKNDGYAPIIVKGPMQAGIAKLSGEDSQPVSALLIATSFLKDKSEIFVTKPGEKPWIDLTLYWLNKLGIRCENYNYEHYITYGNAKYKGFEYAVAGDFSSLLFPIVAALIIQSEITIEYVDMEDVQGDKKVIEVLRSMGAKIDYDPKKHLLKINKTKELIGKDIDANDFIDALPILAVVGCYTKGKTHIYNATIARAKECDRIAAIACELKKMGAKITEMPDGLIVEKSALYGTSVNTYHDHRLVMSLCVAGLVAAGEAIVENIECVAKSYPSFYDDMKKLGASITVLS